MASVFDLANLSGMAYHFNKSSFNNWVRIRNFGVPSGKGFYAEIYANTSKKEAVLSIRGTDFDSGDKSDLLSDAQLATGNTPSQYKRAREAYELAKTEAQKAYGYNHALYLTGHSLGGGLASLVSAYKGGLPTVTFNAPGMKRAYIGGHFIKIIGHINFSYVNTSKMLHIRATGDVVSRGTGDHMGKVEDVYVDNWGDGKIIGTSRHLAQHSIANMIESLRTKPWYHDDLKWA